jgi:SnoaL-like domain
MNDASAVVDNYIASWNERDADARLALVAVTFADDADYVDPLMSGCGIEGIDAMIAAAQQQFPGHHFTLASGPDAHNNHIRFSWTLATAGEEAVAGGTDFARLGADGRIQSVTGFLDPVA